MPVAIRLPIAVSMLICCAACEADPLERLAAAEVRRAPPSVLPEWPLDCGAPRLSPVGEGERLDLVVLRLARERAQLARRLGDCAAWYEALRQAR